MKRLFFSGVALSFAFLACSDNSSTATNSHQLSSNESRDINLTMGYCMHDDLGLLKEADSDELDKAYLVQDEDGYFQIMVPELSDYCGISAQFYSERMGDTLLIGYGSKIVQNGDETIDLGIAVTTCFCKKDHWFDIKTEDADAKYFKYKSRIFKIVNEPAPAKKPESSEN